MRRYAFSVERSGGGSVIVFLTKPDGLTRAVFFEEGKATGYDVSQADHGEFKTTRRDD